MTGDVSQVSLLSGLVEALLTIVAVFSAPKYCDATENRGAYINIGPELKLEYQQFDAVPHPDIKPMVSSPRPSCSRRTVADFFTRHTRRIALC
jgi:hypothetical protein